MNKIMGLVDNYISAVHVFGSRSKSCVCYRQELQAEVERLRVYADRYQFWRSLYDIDTKIDQAVAQVVERATTPEELDAAIDAARSKT